MGQATPFGHASLAHVRSAVDGMTDPLDVSTAHLSAIRNEVGVEPERLEHIKMIQAVVTRMAQNSFLLKGWSVTLSVGILSAAASAKEASFALLALLPAVVFWGLDAFYLRQERLFRALHDDVCGAFGNDPVTFSLQTGKVEPTVKSWYKTLFAKTIVWLHAPLIVSILLVAGLIHKATSKAAGSELFVGLDLLGR